MISPPPPRLARWLAPALAALAAPAAPGCGGNASAESPATANQFVTEYETALCGLVEGCCASRNLPLDRVRCPGAVRATFADALFDETRYAYDRSAAGACLGALRALPPTCEPFAAAAFGPGSDFERACGRAFAPRGAKAPGEPCTGTWECAPAAGPDALASCQSADGTSRACAVRAYVDEAGPCDTGPAPRPDARAGVVRACKPGPLFCAAEGTCQRPAAAGEPCEAGAAGACVGGAFCNGQSQCEPRRGPGATCADAADACDGASFCDPAARACAPRRAPGERCAYDDECLTSCADGACTPAPPDRGDDYTNLCAL